MVPPAHAFPLCERHLAKAWACFEVVKGSPVPEPREPFKAQNWQSTTNRVGAVYFARVRDELKIGWTSNITSRLSSISADALLHVQPGTLEDEAGFHFQFKEHLSRGREWFAFNETTEKMVDEISRHYSRNPMKVC